MLNVQEAHVEDDSWGSWGAKSEEEKIEAQKFEEVQPKLEVQPLKEEPKLEEEPQEILSPTSPGDHEPWPVEKLKVQGPSQQEVEYGTALADQLWRRHARDRAWSIEGEEMKKNLEAFQVAKAKAILARSKCYAKTEGEPL